jgi:hypothetical protein
VAGSFPSSARSVQTPKKNTKKFGCPRLYELADQTLSQAPGVPPHPSTGPGMPDLESPGQRDCQPGQARVTLAQDRDSRAVEEAGQVFPLTEIDAVVSCKTGDKRGVRTHSGHTRFFERGK